MEHSSYRAEGTPGVQQHLEDRLRICIGHLLVLLFSERRK